MCHTLRGALVVLFVVDPLHGAWKDSSADCRPIADAMVCDRGWDADPRVTPVRQLAVERLVLVTGDPHDRCDVSRWVDSRSQNRRRAAPVEVSR